VLDEHYVLLASDCDAPEPEVVRIAQRLEGAMMLPFILLADADGGFLGGSSGAVTPEDLVARLREAAGA
jgi:hypothetical protein